MSEWIKVEDRLPEIKPRHRSAFASSDWKGCSDCVLTVDSWGSVQRVEIGYISEWSQGPKWLTQSGQFNDKVTHWQPLPEPPEAGDVSK